MRRDRAPDVEAASPPDVANDAANDVANDVANDAALDAAYLDGADELSVEERARVEARLVHEPAAQAEHAALRGLITRLRALPPEGPDPDWSAMERAIHEAVGHEAGPTRAWWRRWTWIAPLSAAMTAALVLLVMWTRPVPHVSVGVEPAPARVLDEPAPATERAGDEAVALWLDGAVVDVDPAVAESLVLPGDEDGEIDEVGLLPSTDLAWVDSLDDDALARAEHWLANPGQGPRKKG